MLKIWKKKKNKSIKFVEIVETNLLIHNTLHFDQYSCIAIRLNFFRFSATNLKTNSKFVEIKIRGQGSQETHCDMG